MGGVSHATPVGGVTLAPDAAQTESQPLLEECVGLLKLRQTQRDDVAVQTNLLWGGGRGISFWLKTMDYSKAFQLNLFAHP